MTLDDQAFLAVNRALGAGAPAAILSLLGWLGNGAVLAALIVPAWWALARGSLRRHLAPLVIAAAVGGAAVWGIKIAADRPRPAERFAALGVEVRAPDGVPPDRSFPSGHAQTAFAAATYLALLFPRRCWPCLVLAGIVGLSRVALGVHYPSDVIAGALLGAALALAAFLVARRLPTRGGRGAAP